MVAWCLRPALSCKGCVRAPVWALPSAGPRALTCRNVCCCRSSRGGAAVRRGRQSPTSYHSGVVVGPEEELVVHSRFGGVHLHLDVD